MIHAIMQQQNKEGQKRFIKHLINHTKANELDHITRYCLRMAVLFVLKISAEKFGGVVIFSYLCGDE